MQAALLFLCLYCSDPIDRSEQSVNVGQKFCDRNGRWWVVVWIGELPLDEGFLFLSGQGKDGHGNLLYPWSYFWQMMEEVPQR